MKFKPWRETLSSSRSPFKVLPSFSLSPTRSKTVIAEWVWHSENAASGSFCSSGSVLYRTRTAEAPGSRTLKTGLQREDWPQWQLRHTKKRAWPFLFNLRIFPRRCLAVAIPFFGRLPIKHQQQCKWWWKSCLAPRIRKTPGRAAWQASFQVFWMGKGTLQGFHCLKWRTKTHLLHRTYGALTQSNLRLSPQRAILPYSTGNCFSNETDDSFINAPHTVSYLCTVGHTHYLFPSMLSILSLPPIRTANPLSFFSGSTSSSS